MLRGIFRKYKDKYYVKKWEREFSYIKKMLWNKINSDELINDYEREILFLRNKQKLLVIPYEFVDNYENLEIECVFDEAEHMYYVLHKGKRLYFPYERVENVIASYRQLLMEQDLESPHRYFSDGYEFESQSIFIDVGAAEGIISLEIVESAKRVYLFECDPSWIRALEATFRPWRGKVEIVNKYIGNEVCNNCTTLDELLSKIDTSNKIYVKMDIEGMEYEAVTGCVKSMESRYIIFLCATYHTNTMADKLRTFFQEDNKYEIEFSKNYMLFFYGYGCMLNHKYERLKSPYFRRGIIRAKKYEA